MFTKKSWKNILLSLMAIIACTLIHSSVIQAQNWAALPPYNTLWPLWSPALSPVNPVTGIPTPLVSSLTAATVLPVEPGLTWDPSSVNPWLLYNTPMGMCYYDPLLGVGLWPPSSLLSPTGLPAPLTLPAGYSSLAPTSTLWLATNVPAANQFFQTIYPYFSIPGALPVPPIGIAYPTSSILGVLPPLPVGTTVVPPAYLAPSALL